MLQKFVWRLALGAVLVPSATVLAQSEPLPADTASSSPFRTAEYQQGDVEIVEVQRGRNRGRYYNNRRGNYRRYYNRVPYRGRNLVRPYRYRYTPRYYGTRRFGYYGGYGRRGGVQIGPLNVWW